MARSRDRNTKEHYKGMIRNLKKQVKRLSKENQQLRASLHNYDYQDEEEVVEEPKEVCPKCGSSNYSIIDIVGRLIATCKDCDYRKTVKNG